jgi:hypothetical protein
MSGQGRSDTHLRHCEARSAVAIHVPVPRRPMDCFVPRNDRVGAQWRGRGALAASSHTLYARRIFRPMTILSP